MIEVTHYSPIRIVLVGLGRMLAGAVPLGIGAIFVVMATQMPVAEPSAADPPDWSLAVPAALFLFIGLALFLGGIGRICSAFARNCYLRAGRDGIALRLPVQGWFGRFRVREFNIRWGEIGQLVHFTYRINGIPTARELRIQRRDGTMIKVERHIFSDSTALVQNRLHEIMAGAGR
ncbi:MAG TPA: hypothetical protein VIY51_27975 [Xanthobacteraceae bacterium]